MPKNPPKARNGGFLFWKQWMMYHAEDVAAVQRKSNGKEFYLGLAEIEAMEKQSRNHNY